MAFGPVVNLSSLDGANGFQISGEAPFDTSGFSVSSAGDVNGDGFDDLIIGALGADPNGNTAGASYVVFGKAGGFTANLKLSMLDVANGFRISGEAAFDRSGLPVPSAPRLAIDDEGWKASHLPADQPSVVRLAAGARMS